ncbi:MAG: cysteine desulfurase [Bacteroidota bacterium]
MIEENINTKFDVIKIREDFPILRTAVRGKQLVYFDNAATTQKPQQVIDAISKFYHFQNANIHRGVHELSEIATFEYEKSRGKVKLFINAKSSHEIIFTHGATEAINLVASSFGDLFIKENDEIIISTMEHHSNIVPWQILCQKKNAKLKIIPINDDGEIIFEEFEKLISEKTKLISIVHASNSLGTINPIEKIIEIAHQKGIFVLIDGSQSSAHLKIDVQKYDCDFFVFSGHKLYAPTGIGVLYGKESILEKLPPYQTGGDMISSVTFEKTTFNSLPFKFEAGTPNIEGAIGLGSAIDYLQLKNINEIASYENEILNYATEKILNVDGIKIIGTAKNKTAILSFDLKNIHPHDVATILDKEGIATRSGHHCTQPVMQRFGIPATTRASFSFYNTFEEVDIFINALKKVIEIFR